ncbi:hypothetical protein EYF80_026959 [Liparis tanakae]|uniref:Uncharacterized protein n=1 Tax=Liparis tanakae TaxID=230148 RepID=A0A4Z2HDC4_9TELE|nr:hypothetical protein EYF80_026959 [Liparis tanakae]
MMLHPAQTYTPPQCAGLCSRECVESLEVTWGGTETQQRSRDMIWRWSEVERWRSGEVERWRRGEAEM